MLDECTLAQLVECRAELFVRIHDDRTTPRDGLVQGLASHQEETHAVGCRCTADRITPCQDSKLVVCEEPCLCLRPGTPVLQ